MTDFHGIAQEASGPISLKESKTPGVFEDVTIIREGWGTSGYYPGDVLHRDGPKVFKEGTRIFIDHTEGPIESARNVIGILTADAKAATEGGVAVLKAPIKIYQEGMYNPAWIKERAKDKAIAVSIRCGVDYSEGTRDGRFGKIVTEMTEAFSVDVVARGGAGGSFGIITESARIGEPAPMKEENMPITAEEAAQIAQAVTAGLKPLFDGMGTQLGELKTVVTESKAAPAGVALSAREIAEKVTGAELSKGAQERVFAAVEAAEVPTAQIVDTAISNEKTIAEEAAATLKTELEEAGHAVFDEAGKVVKAETPAGGYQPGTVGFRSSTPSPKAGE